MAAGLLPSRRTGLESFERIVSIKDCDVTVPTSARVSMAIFDEQNQRFHSDHQLQVVSKSLAVESQFRNRKANPTKVTYVNGDL